LKKKVIIGVLAIALAAFSCYVSYVNWKVANPITVAVGLYKVILTDADYAIIKEDPKIAFAKADYTLTEYMESKGYKEDIEKRNGALRTFVSGDSEVTIHRSYNNVYGRWHWKE